MNNVKDDYLYKRFGRGHRFFGDKKEQFCCAARVYQLGYLQVLLISEYFLDGQIDDSGRKFTFLRYIAKHFYRGLDGVYLHSYVSPGLFKWLQKMRQRFLVHRPLPICYTCASGEDDRYRPIITDLAKSFQLSDCDIG